MHRRHFLARCVTAGVAASVTRPSLLATGKLARRPRILLRSSWQSVNIGDIGHTPGALTLFQTHFPEAEITLWAGGIAHGAREMLVAGFPGLRIVHGGIDARGQPDNADLARAWDDADIYVSGSGSGFPASDHALAFRRATGKPLGVFGVSTDPISGFGGNRDPEGGTLASLRTRALALPQNHLSSDLRSVIDACSFFFCRDTISRDYLAAQGVKTPILEFGPDAQLGMHLRDDTRGLAYLAANGLDPGRFICVIPRLRYTPYHKIHHTAPTEVDRAKEAINLRTTEPDHAKLRDMIVRYVRATGDKVLACAEMTYQVQMAKDVLVDPLPDDVKKQVVWRDSYWLPDEAASVYAQALAIFSVECHSPLIAYRNGTPAFYVRQPTDTCKGQMYSDFGADAWVFEVDETDGARLWSRLEAIHRAPDAARAKVKAIMAAVETRQRRMVEAVRQAVHRA